MITIYGIRNCDTMKKAFKWLDEHQIEYRFHDYKKAGIDEATLRSWTSALGWDPLINRRGLTWRKLSPQQREKLDEARAIALMLDNPSLIKRPVLDTGTGIQVGFEANAYQALLGCN